MPARTARAALSATVLGAAVLGSLSACAATAQSVTPPSPTGTVASACRALDARLPALVDGEKSTPARPTSPYTAAWNDIILTCGGPPPTIDPTAQLYTIQGVDWYPQSLPQGGTRFTTVGRVAPVSVIVPARHDPAGDALVDLATAVLRAVPTSTSTASATP